MRGHEAQPLQLVNPLHLPDQSRKAATIVWVAVVVDVLAKQNDLPGAGPHRDAAFLHDVAHRNMALPAAHAGHDAERAVVIAALNHAHVVADSRAAGRRQRLAFRVVVPGREAGQEALVFPDGYDGIEVREPSPEFIALFGHDAAGDSNGPVRRLPGFELMELGVDPIL